MIEKTKVLILGYGEMGHAMEYLLKERQQLDIWEKYPQDNFQSVVLEDAAPKADIVLFCLPVKSAPADPLFQLIRTLSDTLMM